MLALAAIVLVAAGCGGAGQETANTEKASGSWESIPQADRAPKDLGGLTAFHLGRELVVVGSDDSRIQGLAFDLRSESWRRLPTSPLPWRAHYSAVEAGSELIVWGGSSGLEGAEGARYDHRADSWRSMAPSPLAIRHGHTAVWTGEEMLIWGGETRGVCGGPTPSSGAAYDPEVDQWHAIPKAPGRGRVDHAAVWTGEEMLIWGGVRDRDGSCEPAGLLTDGAVYNPSQNRWRRIPNAPIRSGQDPAAFWTGEEMLVWDVSGGALYNPETEEWRPIAEAPIIPRRDQTAVWSGRHLFVWGGLSPGSATGLPGGAVYDPEADRWTKLPVAPLSETIYAGVWAEDSLFLLSPGCCGREGKLPDGAQYKPGSTRRVAAPSAFARRQAQERRQ